MKLLLAHMIPEPDLYLVLIIAILVFFLIAFYLLILTITKRKSKIRQAALKKRYQEIIDQSLFRFLFQNTGSITPEKIGSHKFAGSALFRKVAIKSLVTLHQNYSGEYKEKLELYFVHSRLVNYSLKKLASARWEEKVEGIRDLSNLRYQPAWNEIRNYITHKHEMVQLEALSAMVKMRGLEELLVLEEKTLYLNDWVQSNILFQVKTTHAAEPANLGRMLESRNASLRLLAVRLCDHFNTPKYTPKLKELKTDSSDEILKKEIDATLERMHSYYKSIL